LTGKEIFGGLFTRAPGKYNVILTNPPFGGKEGKEAQTNFAYKTSSTQILFLQLHSIGITSAPPEKADARVLDNNGELLTYPINEGGSPNCLKQLYLILMV
jgi:predicted RNA methylase